MTRVLFACWPFEATSSRSSAWRPSCGSAPPRSPSTRPSRRAGRWSPRGTSCSLAAHRGLAAGPGRERAEGRAQAVDAPPAGGIPGVARRASPARSPTSPRRASAADVIAADASMWGPALVMREAQGIQVALLSPLIYAVIPGPDIPPLGSRRRAAHAPHAGPGADCQRDRRAARPPRAAADRRAPARTTACPRWKSGQRRAGQAAALQRREHPRGSTSSAGTCRPASATSARCCNPPDPPGTAEVARHAPGRPPLGARDRGHLALPGPLPPACRGGSPPAPTRRSSPRAAAARARSPGRRRTCTCATGSRDRCCPAARRSSRPAARARPWPGCGRAAARPGPDELGQAGHRAPHGRGGRRRARAPAALHAAGATNRRRRGARRPALPGERLADRDGARRRARAGGAADHIEALVT